MVKKSFVILFLFLNYAFWGQVPDSVKIERVKRIYRNLEYNTIAFDDFKGTWDITDPLFVREIFNRLISANALRVHGEKPTLKFIKEKAQDIYDGKVFIELKRRYYDDEIESMRFFTESKIDSTRQTYFFDPITDNVQIRHILGDKVYDELKKQFYALNDLTKSYFDSKEAYGFDVNLQIFNPYVMFYSMTTNNRNKFLVSFSGVWGNDKIVIPGWYYPNYIAALRVTYIDYLINSMPHYAYSLEVGTGISSHHPELQTNVSNEVKLFNTGNNLYFKFEGNPLTLFMRNVDNYYFELAGSFSISEFPASAYNLDYVAKFYSTRNYFVFNFTYKNILPVLNIGWLNGSASFSMFDIYNYLYSPKYTQLIDLEPDASKFKYNLDLEASITNYEGMLHFNTALMLNYNFSDNYSYLGLKGKFMLTNTVGFEFKYFVGIPFSGHLPYYRQGSYILFSPILRINY